MFATRAFFALLLVSAASAQSTTSLTSSSTSSVSSTSTPTSTSTTTVPITTTSITTSMSMATTSTTTSTSSASLSVITSPGFSSTFSTSMSSATTSSSTAVPTLSGQRDVIIGALTKNKYVANAYCALGAPYRCFAAGTHAVLSIFFAGYRVTDSGPAHRALDDAWAQIASVRDLGAEVLFARHGDMHALRAIISDSGASTTPMRRDEGAAGGFVVDYYWRAPNRAAYRAFHSTPDLIARIRDVVTQYAQARSAIELCVDFGDAAGVMGRGLLAAGWNGQPFRYKKGVRQRHLDECQIGQLLHDYADVADVPL